MKAMKTTIRISNLLGLGLEEADDIVGSYRT